MARNFNGTSDRITGAVATGTQMFPLTIAAWFNTASLSSTQREICIVQKPDLSIFVALEYRPDVAGSVRANVYNGAAADSSVAVSSANKWYHGAAVFYPGGSNCGAFLNGSNKGTAGSALSNGVLPTEIVIGAYDNAGTPGGFFSGSIADLCIWNTALSDQEIYKLGVEGVRANKVRPNSIQRYWPLDGYGHPALELGPFKQKGVLTGTSFSTDPPLLRSRLPLTTVHSSLAGETIALMQAPQGGGGFTPKFRKTFSGIGGRIGTRQPIANWGM